MGARFDNIAPIGSLLKSEKPTRARRTLKPTSRVRDSMHLEAIRQLPCINPMCRRDPAGVAAHVRFACEALGKPPTGMQTKPSDEWTLPMCQTCHTDGPNAQHKGSELAFYARIKIDPIKTCMALYKASPNVEHMRAIIFTCQTLAGF